jgi:hypothetical protein
MNQNNLILPFVTKTPTEKEDLSFQAELACVVCLAEAQRKKPGLLRDASEKTAFISKVYYPMWVLCAENACIMVDGVNASAYDFVFEEPTKTGFLIEELKKNSLSAQKFLDTLRSQAKGIKEFSSPTKLSFTGLISDGELLRFLVEYFKSGALQAQEAKALLPLQVDAEVAVATSQAFANCLRTLQADAKGVKYASSVLKEELGFHTSAVASEVEQLKEKLELQLAALKPVVDNAVKKLTRKHDKAMATLQSRIDRKMAALENKRKSICANFKLPSRNAIR